IPTEKIMKTVRIFLSLIILAPLTITSCTKTKGPNGTSFEADTLRGRTCEFINLESGKVAIVSGGLERLDELDESGNPRFYTSDIVAGFEKQDSVTAGDGRGFCVRFTVPRINADDYLIIRADIALPAKADFGGGPTDTIQASFRYDAKNSGRTEYIWFLFNKNMPALFLPGKWTISLYNNETKLLSRDFIIAKDE
ncbi:MAG: hypothetical protein ACRCUT_05695, partial [Spirochaetota bacterium]